MHRLVNMQQCGQELRVSSWKVLQKIRVNRPRRSDPENESSHTVKRPDGRAPRCTNQQRLCADRSQRGATGATPAGGCSGAKPHSRPVPCYHTQHTLALPACVPLAGNVSSGQLLVSTGQNPPGSRLAYNKQFWARTSNDKQILGMASNSGQRQRKNPAFLAEA